jgi:hypothetical protein
MGRPEKPADVDADWAKYTPCIGVAHHLFRANVLLLTLL